MVISLNARTRGCIVSLPVSWFLIHPGPLQPEQVRSCSGIYFPAHLGLGTAPGFRNTWWGGEGGGSNGLGRGEVSYFFLSSRRSSIFII